MTILFISHLSQNIAAGMNWSVPARIKAQEQIDEVMWVNTTKALMPHFKNTRAYTTLADLGRKLSLSVLPAPFCHPDVVVFEGLYFKEYLNLGRELRKQEIPYIIVPRGSMTYQAMHNHSCWKKFFAHLIYFNSFIHHAWKIQYLTKQEAADSIKQFHSPFFIVPNGVTMPVIKKEHFSEDGIHAVFIGRLDIYHKGLDFLLDALTQCAEIMRKANFSFSIYGPMKYDYLLISEEVRKRNLNDVVTLNGEVSGKEKQHALLSADIFIMTSRFEGHPMGLIEALSYGIPCLVTPGTNMYEEIRDSDAGWTCQGTVDDIKSSLLQVVHERDVFASKSNNARLLARRYDWSKLANDFHKEIQSLCAMV